MGNNTILIDTKFQYVTVEEISYKRMGCEYSEIFHQVNTYKSLKNSERIYEKILHYKYIEQFNEVYQKYMKLKKKNRPYYLRIYHVRNINQKFCSQDNHQLYVYFQSIKTNLRHKIQQIQSSTKQFDQKFIWKLAGFLITALKSIHQKKIFYPLLNPQNILIDQHGQFKLNDIILAQYLFDQKKDGYLYVWKYIDPQLNKCLVKGFTQINRFDPYSSNVFYIGLILFSVITLKNPFLNENQQTQNLEYLKRSLYKKYNKYSIKLIGLVQKMLEESFDKRPDITQLYNYIKTVKSFSNQNKQTSQQDTCSNTKSQM